MSSHLEIFNQWLEDVKFKSNGTPGDISFMIAPSCPLLLQRKLELKNIQFIKSDKIISTPTPIHTSIPTPIPTATPKPLGIADLRYEKPNMQVIESSIHKPSRTLNDLFHTVVNQLRPLPININIANKSELTKAFQGTRIKQKTIDKLIDDRNTTIYRDIEDMALRLKLTTAVKEKLQTKLDKGEISFSS